MTEHIGGSSKMADRVRALDWAATPLGPVAAWPERLAGAIETMLAAPQLASLAVGPERIFLYNDAASQYYGDRHPAVFGQPIAQAFRHEFSAVEGYYDRVFAGESLHVPAQPLDPARTGTPEVFDAYLSPVRNSEGDIIAAYMTGFAATDRYLAEARLRDSEAGLAAELAGTELLRSLAERLVTEESSQTFYEELLAAAMTITRSDAGTVQLYEPETGSLTLLVTHGLAREMTDHFHRVDAHSDTACGIALRTGERSFVDFDDKADEAGRMHVAAGYHSAQATPLLSRGGEPLGMLNTHWRDSLHRPTEPELRFLDLLARQAADLMEARQARDALRESEERQAFLLKLSDELRPLRDAEEIQRVAARMIGQYWGVNAHYAPIEKIDGKEYFVVQHAYAMPGRAKFDFNYPVADFPGAASGLLLGVMAVSDVAADPRLTASDKSGFAAAEVGAYLFAPLVKNGRLDALFSAHVPQPRTWTAAEKTLMENVAERTWTAVERARVEAALRGSEERLRGFGEASQDILWIRDAETLQWQYLTPAFEAIYGISREEALTGDNYRVWQDLIVPEDREHAVASIAKVREGEYVSFQFRVRRPSDGAIRWLRETDFPIRDASGKVVLIGGIGHDLTSLKRAEERQATLLAELQHRVRNTLAVTRSIISRSDDGDRSTEDYVQHLQGRIAALARTQVLLTRAAGSDIDLDGLIRDELLAQVASWDRITIDGPDVHLSPKVAEVLTLAIHELATNATKYGAFSKPDGRLEINWRVDTRQGQDWLELDWKEHGVPIVAALPRRRGFGTDLISRRIPYELQGDGRLELKPGGVESHIEFPFLPGESILQTDAGGQ